MFSFVLQDRLASTELARIAGEFDEEGIQTEGPGNKGDDLLAMMDELWRAVAEDCEAGSMW